jgi:hypothetical protein
LEDGFDHLEFAGLDRDFQRRRLREGGGETTGSIITYFRIS